MKGFKAALVAALAAGTNARSAMEAEWANQQFTTAAGGPGFRTQLGTGITLTIESDPQEDHAMKVERVHYDPVQNLVILKGDLSRDITEGDIAMRMGLAEMPAEYTAFQRMKSKVAFHYAVGKKVRRSVEPLCQHLGKQQSCPLKAGPQSIRFAFEHLPKLALVGKYLMEANMTDAMGKAVAKIRAHLDVPQRSRSETHRLLWETNARRLCSGGGATPSCDICEGRGVYPKETWDKGGNNFENCNTFAERVMNDPGTYDNMGACAEVQSYYSEVGCCMSRCDLDGMGGIADKAQPGTPGALPFALGAAALVLAKIMA